MNEYIIYHNPRCSKSRQALQLLRDAGIEPTIVEYLKTPLVKGQLRNISQLLGLRPKEFVRKAREKGVNVYTEMILGLPEETVESWKTGLCELLDAGQDSIDIWFCQVFGNTELNLNREKYRKSYKIYTSSIEGYVR